MFLLLYERFWLSLKDGDVTNSCDHSGHNYKNVVLNTRWFYWEILNFSSINQMSFLVLEL